MHPFRPQFLTTSQTVKLIGILWMVNLSESDKDTQTYRKKKHIFSISYNILSLVRSYLQLLIMRGLPLIWVNKEQFI